MLNLAQNRLSYGDILLAPENFHLDFAIGTTYSLDLDSLLGASLFLLSGEINSDMLDNKMNLLGSLIRNKDKIALFCENGQIHYPRKGSNILHILLEDMVFQVTNNNFSKYCKYASFHPKFWLLRFKDDDGNMLYRIIVLSRNLTFDRSWDISCVIDGEIGEETDKNNPIISFLNYLSNFADGEKTSIIDDIADDLKLVHFSLKDSVFDDFEFMINGIEDDEYIIQNQLLFKEKSIDDILIISPFLSKNLIERFNNYINPNSNAILITQSDSLLGWSFEDCSRFEVYIVRDDLIDGKNSISNDYKDDFSRQDIHAKIYAVQFNHFTELYLGSLNASCNALMGNVELMMRLTASSEKLNVKQLSDSLFNVDEKNPFEKVDWNKIDDDSTNENDKLNDFIKYFVRLNSHANVIQNDEDYNIELIIDDLDFSDYDELDIVIKPLFGNKFYKLKNKMTFEKLNKKDLSKFFAIRINNNFQRVVKILTNGMPEDRFDEVISSVINNDVDFILFVSYLLGDNFVFEEYCERDNEKISDYNFGSVALPELYEKMLKTSYYNPDRFDDLDLFIKYLSEDNIPEGFKHLYSTFKMVLDKNGKN